MGELLSSMEPVAAWRWAVHNDGTIDTLETSVAICSAISEALRITRLFQLHRIDVEWSGIDGRVLPVTSQIRNARRIADNIRAEEIRKICPAGHPEAAPSRIAFMGLGFWVTADSVEREEFGLFALSSKFDGHSPSVEIDTFHDIWALSDFFGNPHPEIYEQNAPRLAAGLQAVEDTLGFPATPCEPTFFGTPYNYGVRAHTGENGSGIDVSDHL